MNIKFLFFLFYYQLASITLNAQNTPAAASGQIESDSLAGDITIPMDHGTKSIGLNMTPMLKQIMPFNRSNSTIVGPYFVHFRRVKKSGTIARTGLGWDLASDLDIPNINLRFGWERRRNIYSRWTYNRGFDFVISTGGFNIDRRILEFESFLGIQFTWGLDYFVLPNVSLNIETGLALGIGSDSNFTTFFIPPISLNLNYCFVKM